MRRPSPAKVPPTTPISPISPATTASNSPLDPLSLHRDRALMRVDLGAGALVKVHDVVRAYAGTGTSVHVGALMPFQGSDRVTRKPTVWVATLRKLRVIVRAALPGDIVLILRRQNARDFYTHTDFDFGVPPWVLSDMLVLSRWLKLQEMTVVERFNVQQELLTNGGNVLYVRDGSYFDAERDQANRDLTRLSLVEGVIHYYTVQPAMHTDSYSKGMLIREFQKNYPKAALTYAKALDDMFLDGGARLIPSAIARMDVLKSGRLLVHPVTNERGVKFWSWCRRETTIFNDTMIDPRELAIMGQEAARWVLFQLGFPMGLETDEYLVDLAIKSKYLLRKGWGHLRIRDKEIMTGTAVSISEEQRKIDERNTRTRELDERDPSFSPCVPPVLPDPKPYGKIRRARGQKDQELNAPSVFHEFPLTEIR